MPVRLHACSLAALMLCSLASAHGAELSVECQPVFAAMEKTLRANHTTTSTHGAETVRGVTMAGASYLQIKGAWRRSPITIQQNIDMSRENLKDARSFTCKALPDGVADGTPVANYVTHTVTDDGTQDSRISIAKATGLAVVVENRNAGDPGLDITTHYGYTDVKAPM